MISRTCGQAAKPLGFAVRIESICSFGPPFRREAKRKDREMGDGSGFRGRLRPLSRVRLDPACSVKAGRIERVCRIEQPRQCSSDAREEWGRHDDTLDLRDDRSARPCRLSRRSASNAARAGQPPVFGLRGHGDGQSQFDRDALSFAQERRRPPPARRSLHRRPTAVSRPLLNEWRRPAAREKASPRGRPCANTGDAPRAPVSAGSPRSPARSGKG